MALDRLTVQPVFPYDETSTIQLCVLRVETAKYDEFWQIMFCKPLHHCGHGYVTRFWLWVTEYTRGDAWESDRLQTRP